APAGPPPHGAWRHFTSTNTQAPPSRQTRSSSPRGNRTLRSTTTRPARTRKAAAASSARRPSDWRGSAIPANTTGASARECPEKLTQHRLRVSSVHTCTYTSGRGGSRVAREQEGAEDDRLLTG